MKAEIFMFQYKYFCFYFGIFIVWWKKISLCGTLLIEIKLGGKSIEKSKGKSKENYFFNCHYYNEFFSKTGKGGRK